MSRVAARSRAMSRCRLCSLARRSTRACTTSLPWATRCTKSAALLRLIPRARHQPPTTSTEWPRASRRCDRNGWTGFRPGSRTASRCTRESGPARRYGNLQVCTIAQCRCPYCLTGRFATKVARNSNTTCAGATVTTNIARYQRIARYYDLLDTGFERRRYRPLRPLLFAGLSGALLDAGIGTGRNCEFYPSTATVSGIDSSPAMLAIARERCPVLATGGRLFEMDVTALEFPAASFDGAV